jgi:hypothetical protein
LFFALERLAVNVEPARIAVPEARQQTRWHGRVVVPAGQVDLIWGIDFEIPGPALAGVVAEEFDPAAIDIGDIPGRACNKCGQRKQIEERCDHGSRFLLLTIFAQSLQTRGICAREC